MNFSDFLNETAELNKNVSRITSTLKDKGFDDAEETAELLISVINDYEGEVKKLSNQLDKMKNLIKKFEKEFGGEWNSETDFSASVLDDFEKRIKEGVEDTLKRLGY